MAQTNPLALAISEGHEDRVRDLLASGANANEVYDDGWTPLMLAAEHEHLGILEVLLDHGADPNLSGYEGQTPLHVAVDISIDGTANRGDPDGSEPIAVVQRLLRAGSNVQAQDRRGKTPVDWARDYGCSRMVSVLLGQSQ